MQQSLDNKIDSAVQILKENKLKSFLELNEYTDNLPSYRQLNVKILANIKCSNDTTYEEIYLDSPKDFPENLHYDNFVNISIYTGLLHLKKYLPEMLQSRVQDAELVILQNIYKDIRILKAWRVIPTEVLEEMLEQIITSFYKNNTKK